MQFLLLLSALLSAITGGLSSARGEAARVDQAVARLIAPVPAPRRDAAEMPPATEPCASFREPVRAIGMDQQVPVHPMPLASVRLIE